MKILFVHQNFPGQFLHLAPELARRGHECLALTDGANRRSSTTPTQRYRHDAPPPDPAATRLGRSYTQYSDRGVACARAALQLRAQQAYVPDVILGHSGWGETLFLKEVWPEAKLIIYAEFFYRGRGADVGFDPEFSAESLDQSMITQSMAGHLALSLLHADAGLCPTEWQASTFPADLRGKISVIFDGVDTGIVRPDPAASLTLPNGRTLRAGDEVLTYVSRNLEPYRGFHSFMRTLPEVLAARPQAQVVIIGGEGASYGPAPKGGGSWKEVMLAELGDKLDPARVHFLGKVPYATFLSALQVSRVHAYLTYPFVLSWSMIEAMAAGAHVVASRTAPVCEVLEDGVTGTLVDFFDHAGWVRALTDALGDPARHAALGPAARRAVLARHDLKTHCLPRQIAFVEGFAGG